ncbi:ArsR family transcriptional regulator [Thermococcus sp. Bubb.Bath]|uniref:ArsR family transcriptional regulator n=1 Tax=Thermococcus sp. Bubb.Bath TaxID=1638242 RepID=UPI00143A822C|nr:ArsR family transcriptional regulator [Thermococcus sp. Bubb.Bath]NJF24506.1 ArsR family transcriptional regulator [Thermococcus sp. Bubb.Bath]
MLGRRKDMVYKVLATKKRAVALQHLSSELETPMPALLSTLKKLESDGLVEVFYGREKASIMVRAKTIDDYV